ncbi:hepatocyte growth factor-regulated tyrosine kinase substrate, partial [Clonorchis sinensis]
MMKNCGSPVFEEVATPEFMQILSALTTVLTCIQNWAFVFKDKPEYSAIQDTYEELRNKGYTFPEFSENDAMFSVVCAPNWKEESSCHRCKVAFTTFRRRVGPLLKTVDVFISGVSHPSEVCCVP